MGDQLSKVESHIDAGVGAASGAPLTYERSGSDNLASRQAAPSSSGVAATGEKARMAWIGKSEPFASSSATRPRSVTSLTSITSLMWSRAVKDLRRRTSSSQRLSRPRGRARIAHPTRNIVARTKKTVRAALIYQRSVQNEGGIVAPAPCAPARRDSHRPNRRSIDRRGKGAAQSSARMENPRPLRPQLCGALGEPWLGVGQSSSASCIVAAMSLASAARQIGDTTTSGIAALFQRGQFHVGLSMARR